MSEPYLILHKVRGEPAYDIAERFNPPDGTTWWIISTSGHRAYPWRFWPISALDVPFFESMDPLPQDWPDHYPQLTKGAKKSAPPLSLSDLEELTTWIRDHY